MDYGLCLIFSESTVAGREKRNEDGGYVFVDEQGEVNFRNVSRGKQPEKITEVSLQPAGTGKPRGPRLIMG